MSKTGDLVRSVIFLAFGLAILHGLAGITATINPDGTSTFLQIDQQNLDVVLKNRNSVKAIVLGCSHGNDIDFSTLNVDGYTLARAWGDLFEVQYYLSYIVPRLPELKAVFIPISYFTLEWDNANVEEISIRRTQIYQTIPSWIPISGDYRHFIIGRGTQLIPIQSVLRVDNWQGVFYGFLNHDWEHPVQITDATCEHPEPEELNKLSESRANEQIQFAREVQKNRPTIHDDTYHVLKEIITHLDSKEIDLVLFTPPYYERYLTHYLKSSPDSITHVINTMSDFTGNYSILYFDYSKDERFVSDFTLFKDADHLNACGKKQFSSILYEEYRRASTSPK